MGPGEDYPGGILTVINELVNSKYLRKFNVKRIVTVSKKNKYVLLFFLVCNEKSSTMSYSYVRKRKL